MFMMEKPLMIIIFMYSTSFGLIGAQYVFGDVYGVQMQDINGSPIKTQLFTYTNTNAIITNQNNVTSTSRATVVTNAVGAAAGFAWNLIQIISGTYIFNILLLFGIPMPVIAGLTLIYFIVLWRAYIGYVRGI